MTMRRPAPGPSRRPVTLLGFDTSTERLSAGLLAEGRAYLREEAGGALASAALLPAVHALFDEAGHTLADLDAIAFGRGPGAFTGLRTACSVAQGLGLGLGKPLLPIDTLLIVAEDAREEAEAFAVWACIDARMDEIYAAAYVWRERRWVCLREPMLADCATLAAAWQAAPPQHIAGNAVVAFAGRLPTGSARLHPQARPGAAALLRLAEAAWHNGEALDPADALPLYVRDRVAATTAERAQQRASVS